MNEKLKRYAQKVIQHGGVANVWVLNGNDIQGLLYELVLDVKQLPEDEAGEAIIDFIESHTAIQSDLAKIDTYYKSGDRYFRLAFGAGASVIDVTHAFEVMPKSTLVASADNSDDAEIQDIRRRAGVATVH